MSQHIETRDVLSMFSTQELPSNFMPIFCCMADNDDDDDDND